MIARRLLVAVVCAVVLAACSDGGGEREASPTPSATAVATPAQDQARTADCEPNGEFTPAQTEGPYFKPGSPEKSDLYADVNDGTKLVLTGSVLSTQCEPLARAKLDFWQADHTGIYDQTAFRLRGHQFTDDSGNYRLTTLIPGEYPGRTPHIHVKVTPPVGPVLITQLYVPGERHNQSDSIFDERLLMDMSDADEGRKATFDFILVTG